MKLDLSSVSEDMSEDSSSQFIDLSDPTEIPLSSASNSSSSYSRSRQSKQSRPQTEGGRRSYSHEKISKGCSLIWQDVEIRSLKTNKNIIKRSNGVVLPGEMLAIMGSSGAGKTTLLRVDAMKNRVWNSYLCIGKTGPKKVKKSILNFFFKTKFLIKKIFHSKKIFIASTLKQFGLPKCQRQRGTFRIS